MNESVDEIVEDTADNEAANTHSRSGCYLTILTFSILVSCVRVAVLKCSISKTAKLVKCAI